MYETYEGASEYEFIGGAGCGENLNNSASCYSGAVGCSFFDSFVYFRRSEERGGYFEDNGTSVILNLRV